MKDLKRGIRRQCNQRRAGQVARLFLRWTYDKRPDESRESDEAKYRKDGRIFRDHATACSRPCCSHGRRYDGPTLRERRADMALREPDGP